MVKCSLNKNILPCSPWAGQVVFWSKAIVHLERIKETYMNEALKQPSFNALKNGKLEFTAGGTHWTLE